MKKPDRLKAGLDFADTNPSGLSMLITLRREGEALLIGDEIEIVIVHVGRSRVRIGIQAPRKYRVIPGEDRPTPPPEPPLADPETLP